MRLLKANLGIIFPAPERQTDIPDSSDVAFLGSFNDVQVFFVSDFAVPFGGAHEEEFADVFEGAQEGGGVFVVGNAELQSLGFELCCTYVLEWR